MYEFENHLTAWRSSVAGVFRHREELLDELLAHLEEEAAAQLQQGYGLDAAFARAVAKLGAPEALAAEFRKAPAASRT